MIRLDAAISFAARNQHVSLEAEPRVGRVIVARVWFLQPISPVLFERARHFVPGLVVPDLLPDRLRSLRRAIEHDREIRTHSLADYATCFRIVKRIRPPGANLHALETGLLLLGGHLGLRIVAHIGLILFALPDGRQIYLHARAIAAEQLRNRLPGNPPDRVPDRRVPRRPTPARPFFR